MIQSPSSASFSTTSVAGFGPRLVSDGEVRTRPECRSASVRPTISSGYARRLRDNAKVSTNHASHPPLKLVPGGVILLQSEREQPLALFPCRQTLLQHQLDHHFQRPVAYRMPGESASLPKLVAKLRLR